jgi:GH25 family lysozyme M1 (1,4-beta-N-acetylmuramidase)
MSFPNPPNGWKRWIDISRYNPIEDSSAVISEVDGVAARLSVGNYYTDRTYEYNYEWFKGHIPFIAYMVVRPGISAIDHLRKVMESLDGRMPDGLVMDSELHQDVNGNTRPQKEIAQLSYDVLLGLRTYGLPVATYTRQTFWNPYVMPVAQQWPEQLSVGWMAHYYWPNVSSPRVANGWADWDLWQFSNKGRILGISINGVSVDVDLNWVKPNFHNLFSSIPTPPTTPIDIGAELNAIRNAADSIEAKLS